MTQTVTETEKKTGAPVRGRPVSWAYPAFFPVTIIYMEAILALFTYRQILWPGAAFIALFSIAAGGVLFAVCALLHRQARLAAMRLLTFVIFLIFAVQTVYYEIFKTFTVVSSVSRAGDVLTSFWAQALSGIGRSIVPLLLLAVPFILLCAFGRRFVPHERSSWRLTALLLAAAAAVYCGAVWCVTVTDGGIMSYRYAYYDAFSPEMAVPRFGMLTSVRLDLKNAVNGGGTEDPEIPPEEPVQTAQPEQTLPVQPSQPAVTVPETPPVTDVPEPAEPVTDIPAEPEPEPEVVDTSPNVMEIDFETLISGETDSVVRGMHEYFASVEPTNKNEYTGMFKGKNLVWIVAEAFSSLCLDDVHTPTLSKMAREGFVFNNFYNPVWGVSTSDGEYVTLTSLIPKSGVWSFSRSAKNDMHFAMGNLMRDMGYNTRAYHDNTYTYYDRDSSHPNMGYDYVGVGNGLNITKQWPESDLEMMQETVGDYVGTGQPFHVYYMSVSGHLQYTFNDNMMSYKHLEDVRDMRQAGYSIPASAYVACQMEFDQAVQYLIDSLDAAGELDDTVIVISGDHYPYGLEQSELEELAGHKLDKEFEIYRSALIIWNSAMETVEVDKYCCSLDVLPTLLNLFGIEYDSRLLMGRDILSDSEPLVIFQTRSFICGLGRYDCRRDKFIPNEGAEVPDGYAAEVMKTVNARFEYSKKILEKDYYRVLFGES